jgi:hypothetical protein
MNNEFTMYFKRGYSLVVKAPFILVYTSYMPRVMPRVNYFLYFLKNQDLKMLGFFCKVIPKSLKFGGNA